MVFFPPQSENVRPWRPEAERFGLPLPPRHIHLQRLCAGVKLPPRARLVFRSKDFDNSERIRGWPRRNRLQAALPSSVDLSALVQPPVGAAWTGFTPLQRQSTRWCAGFAARCWGSHAGDESGLGFPSLGLPFVVYPGEYALVLWLGQRSAVRFRPLRASFGAPFRCSEVLPSVPTGSECVARGVPSEHFSGRAFVLCARSPTSAVCWRELAAGMRRDLIVGI